MCDRQAERGSVTMPAVIGIGVLLVCFVVVGQFAVWVYARGALRSAVQAGARSASRVDAPAGECERAFDAARQQLLAGEVGRGVGAVRCEIGIDVVTVEVDAHFDSWLPVTPDWETTVRAVAVREAEPA